MLYEIVMHVISNSSIDGLQDVMMAVGGDDVFKMILILNTQKE